MLKKLNMLKKKIEQDKEGFYLVMTSIITVLMMFGFCMWLCWMGERHPELTQQRVEWNSHDNECAYICCFIDTVKQD